MNVGRIEISTSVKPAKYLARMIVESEMGLVNNNSMVPVLFSSENERMVIAGISMIKMIGLIEKNGKRSAVPPSKIFVSFENTQRNKEFSTK